MSALVSASVLREWERLLVNRSRPYALQQRDGSYRWLWQPLTRQLLADHLAGEVTLALSSLDGTGLCRWACLDADAPDGLAHLLELRTGLADLGFAGVLEASRRGGHLWLFFTDLVPATRARAAILGAMSRVYAQGVAPARVELYPDTDRPGALGHAVRLPLGVHRRTGQRYPLIGSDGRPLTFSSTEASVTFVLAQARVPARWLHAHWEMPVSGDGEQPHAAPSATRSVVIRWVDAQVSPLDLLGELAPASALRPMGQGFLGWCPFHEDDAPQADGSPGTPSLYVVRNARYGWSWRCLSTHCRLSEPPMKHSFRLLCELLGCDAQTGIAAARARWPSLKEKTP